MAKPEKIDYLHFIDHLQFITLQYHWELRTLLSGVFKTLSNTYDGIFFQK